MTAKVKETSQYLIANSSAKFSINYFDDRIDLDNLSVDDKKVYFSTYSESDAKQSVIDKFKETFNKTLVEEKDVSFSNYNAQTPLKEDGTGYIEVTAKDKNEYIKGATKFVLVEKRISLSFDNRIVRNLGSVNGNGSPLLL
ncbi:hypothetical protein [Spiroplasma tabanidicola]|uniref:Uncharacterized protein n=1 Tax=Spiroplasma tabanidicola TaxID=324079 RepID=A0A6I6C3Q2_9MOLU|nr:hypothetical protein [Spiroplasma tabanidicola]QGS51427.1 hypothetical protein STABA_v1c00600 [Spiroplasma tabanidicola]